MRCSGRQLRGWRSTSCLTRGPTGWGISRLKWQRFCAQPASPSAGRSRQYYFTHAKFFVIDDRSAVVSTANFSQAAFNSNRELLVFDHNRADVHDLSNVFRSDWDHIPVGRLNNDLVLSPDARPILSTFLSRARSSIDVYAEEVARSCAGHPVDPIASTRSGRSFGRFDLHESWTVELAAGRSLGTPSWGIRMFTPKCSWKMGASLSSDRRT